MREENCKIFKLRKKLNEKSEKEIQTRERERKRNKENTYKNKREILEY